MITIGIVLYNEEKHISLLERNLALLAEYPRHFHVVVVDNASTDQTRKHLAAFRQRFRLEVILRASNHMGEARQAVIEKCGTPWVGFIDGDCEINASWVEVALETLNALPCDVAAFGGPWIPQGAYREQYEALFAMPFGNFSLPQLSFKNGKAAVAHIPTANVVYRRQDLENIGGFSHKFVRVGEDLDVSFRLRCRQKKLLMIADMSIGHYLPESISAWCRKIFIYGRGRVQVAVEQSAYLDRILLLPLLFLAVMSAAFFFEQWWMFIAYIVGVGTFAGLYAKQAPVVKVARLLMCTHFSYALGMAYEWSRQAYLFFSRREKHVQPPDMQTATAKNTSFASENF